MHEDTFLAELDSEIEKEVNKSIGALQQGSLNTMHDLLSGEFLEALLDHHRLIGQRLARLVRQGTFPLAQKGFNSSRHNQYQVVRPKSILQQPNSGIGHFIHRRHLCP